MIFFLNCTYRSFSSRKIFLITRYCDGIYNSSYGSTIGVEFKIKNIYIQNRTIKLQIWYPYLDRFRQSRTFLYRGTSGYMLCYDITDEYSFEFLKDFLDEIENNGNSAAIKYLIGTKCECENQRKISKQKAQDFADQFGLKFYEVSSKENINVDESFNQMANDILDNWDLIDPTSNIKKDAFSIIEDLRKFYERKEFCDDEIGCYDGNYKKTKIPIHKFIIQNRLHINDNIFQKKIKPILSQNNKKDVESLLEWVYLGRTQSMTNYSTFRDLKEKLSKVCQTTFDIGLKGLINDFKKIMNDEESKDFEIISNKERIKVHKIMLIIRSELYRGMFLSVTEDKSNSVHDYSHFKTETIRAMINFFYTDDIPNRFKQNNL
ncbi:ras-related protein rab-13 [Anaeramoeba ignava]|uniref:Ras-related protein rab-13 n=1 Tax=Anaeramoeba ignava TaxID=1746090 RepID=A0A9Q0RE85_ANAIG|nr:ras-related protein rab-13 [Anaeramoeba ignava]